MLVREVTITIPILLILKVLGIYIFIGSFMPIPLFMWSRRFISNPAPWKTYVLEMGEKAWALVCLRIVVLWLPILVVSIATEIRYRKKGYL